MRLSDIHKVNFWAYDLFGYLLPGVTFIAGVALGESRASKYIASLWTHGTIRDYVFLVVLAYVSGTCISAISSLLIEANCLQWTFRYPTTRLFPTHGEPPRRGRWAAFGRWVKQRWFYSPFRWFGHLIAPNYCNAYPEEFQAAVKSAFARVFNQDFSSPHTRFWLCWGYISLHHPAAYRRGSHFVELYGCSRNACVSFLLIALLPILSHAPFRTWVTPMPWYNWSGPSIVIALFFFANYLKLFKRMDDEMFHAFLVAERAPLREQTGPAGT